MKERPILFTGDMALAILEDRKTETRRIIPRRIPADVEIVYRTTAYGCDWWSASEDMNLWLERCRYGTAGDRLWVKERAYIAPEGFCDPHDCNRRDYEGRARLVGYTVPSEAAEDYGLKARSPLLMPRWASRLTLDIVSIRAERLQSITEAGAIAEGITRTSTIGRGPVRMRAMGWRDYACDDPTAGVMSPIESYRTLWDSINARPKPMYIGGKIDHYVSHPWEDVRETRTYRGKPWIVVGNPWVWVVGFERLKV